MKEVLELIQQRLITKVTDLKYIDENWGQLDYYGTNIPVQWPCCLIDVESVIWTNQANKQQQGYVRLSFDIANLKLTNTSGKAPATQRNKAWNIHAIIQQVHQSLHTWCPGATASRMYRKSSGRIKRDDGVQQHRIIYECTVAGDFSIEMDTVTGLNLEAEINRGML